MLPGSLDLGESGAVRWTLAVSLRLKSGEELTESVRVDGSPPELEDVGPEHSETVAVLEQGGAKCRLVLACAKPRLGASLHIGVEVRPKERARTGVAGLVSAPDPQDTLRPLRRVRVELLRLVDVLGGPTVSTVLHASGKSLRYPGRARAHPPLRVMFSLPTRLHPGVLSTGGEISSRTPYHNVRFVVRASLGFGLADPVRDSAAMAPADWRIEQEITIRPSAWVEPRAVVMEGGREPVPGAGIGPEDYLPPDEEDTEEAREAYRRKGRDVVGNVGTTRHIEGGEAPPPFEGAGPSGTTSVAEMELPTFHESEALMRSGQAPMLRDNVQTERLMPVAHGDYFQEPEVGRRASLTGELATWIEYDGYETFSLAPPPATASFGTQGSMDPPSGDEGDDGRVVADMVGRLGMTGQAPAHPAELMEQLGLGHGTRVVDLHDDMPPGIDEPSLPALPGFGSPQSYHQPAFVDPFAGAAQPQVELDHPPSFDASEAAEAVGGVAHSRSRVGSIRIAPVSAAEEAPPEYFGAGGGPPAYS